MSKKLRKKEGETDTQLKARQEAADAQAQPSTDERVNNLEIGMGQMVEGMNAIMAKLKEGPSDAGVDHPPKTTEKVIELPSPTISLGEISMRRDLAEFLQDRVKWLDESGERPGWTIERELEMMVKYTKKSAETTAAAADSRGKTLSGVDK